MRELLYRKKTTMDLTTMLYDLYTNLWLYIIAVPIIWVAIKLTRALAKTATKPLHKTRTKSNIR